MRVILLVALILISLTTTAHAVSFDQNPDPMEQLKVARLQVDTGLFDHAKQQAIQIYMSHTASDAEKAYALYLLGLSMFRQSAHNEQQNIPWEMLEMEFPDSLHAISVRMVTHQEETEAELDSNNMPAIKLFALGERYELTSHLRSPLQTRGLRDIHWLNLIEDHPESAAADMARSIMPVYE